VQHQAGFVLPALKWRSDLGDMQWEGCLPRARCGRHTITSAAAEQSRMELCELCFLLTNVAKVIFFFSESFFKMNLN